MAGSAGPTPEGRRELGRGVTLPDAAWELAMDRCL